MKSSAPLGSAAPAASAAIAGMTLEKPLDLATGSFAALGAAGLVVRKRDGSFLVARLDGKPVALEDDGKAFSHGRTVLVDHDGASMAYWNEGGAVKRRLVNADGTTSPVEVVIDEALDGYLPAAIRAGDFDVVAYVAKRLSKEGEKRARIWIEGRGTFDLSPSGSGVSSLYLVPRSPSDPKKLAAIWIDGRSAMAPVHAAEIDVTTAPAKIENEGIVWISPPSDLTTDLSALLVGSTVVTLFAVPKNGADFGLAAAPVTFGAAPLNDAAWLDYPNGLDPAPVIPVHLCGQSAIVIARPTARPIDAPKAVELATVEANGRVTVRQRIAEAGRIDHVSAWASPAGDGWIGWVGDGRTKVRHVKCK